MEEQQAQRPLGEIIMAGLLPTWLGLGLGSRGYASPPPVTLRPHAQPWQDAVLEVRYSPPTFS